jgi:hypothetical protein
LAILFRKKSVIAQYFNHELIGNKAVDLNRNNRAIREIIGD